jgi:hypothetical protein
MDESGGYGIHGTDDTGGQAVTQYVDLDGDGNPDAALVDTDGDGQTDVQYVDLDGDGVVDVIDVDVNADGQADLQIEDTDGDGVLDTAMADYNGDGVADETVTAAQAGAYPDATGGQPSTGDGTGTDAGTGIAGGGAGQGDDTTPYGSDDAGYTSGPFPVGSDTDAVLASTNAAVTDAATIAHSATDPGSVSQADLDAAMHRAENAGRYAEQYGPQVTGQEMHNDAMADQARSEAEHQAQEQAGQVAVDTQRTVDAANAAISDSQTARGQ